MRKIAAHYIFPISGEPIKKGLLTLDDNGRILSISALSKNEEESVEFYNGIICPGFVNAHCHLELSALKGIVPRGTGLADFTRQMSQKPEVDKEEQVSAILNADNEMLAEGIVAVGDISNTSISFDIKASSSIFYHNFIEVYGSNPAVAEQTFNNGVALVAKASLQGLTASLTPHAPYSMSDKLFANTLEEAVKSGILSIHNQESREENEYFELGTGYFAELYKKGDFVPPAIIHKPSIFRTLPLLSKDTRTLLIHNSYTTEADYDAATNTNSHLSWVLCPNSNLYIESTLPPVNMFYQKGANVAIGTDSLASNSRLSVLEELKTLNLHFPHIPLQELLKWATIGGAQALKAESYFGSLDIGKSPGIVLIEGVDLQNLRLTENSRVSLLYGHTR